MFGLGRPYGKQAKNLIFFLKICLTFHRWSPNDLKESLTRPIMFRHF